MAVKFTDNSTLETTDAATITAAIYATYFISYAMSLHTAVDGTFYASVNAAYVSTNYKSILFHVLDNYCSLKY